MMMMLRIAKEVYNSISLFIVWIGKKKNKKTIPCWESCHRKTFKLMIFSTLLPFFLFVLLLVHHSMIYWKFLAWAQTKKKIRNLFQLLNRSTRKWQYTIDIYSCDAIWLKRLPTMQLIMVNSRGPLKYRIESIIGFDDGFAWFNLKRHVQRKRTLPHLNNNNKKETKKQDTRKQHIIIHIYIITIIKTDESFIAILIRHCHKSN